MRYLKTYENFSKEELNVNDYDWQYFFQELIDDCDVTINFISPFNNKDGCFNFYVRSTKFIPGIEFHYYETYNGHNIHPSSDLSSLGYFENSIESLINRVETLDGRITIIYIEQLRNEFAISISTDVFESFKK